MLIFAGRLACVLCGVAALVLPAQVHAANSPDRVIVVNPVTLNPATPNPVTIVNPPGAPSTVTVANPVSAEDIAKALGVQHPFTAQLNCSSAPGTNCTTTLPASPGQRTVVEYIAATCGASISGQALPPLDLIVDIEENNTSINFASFSMGASQNGTEKVSQLIKAYLDPGAVLAFEAGALAAPLVSCHISVSGQRIDSP